MKLEDSLNTSALNTEVKLMEKCKAKNEIKKSPESAMATFLAMDELKTEDFAIRLNNLFKKITQKYSYLLSTTTFSL